MFAQQGQDEDGALALALTTHHPRAFRPFRAVLAAVAVTATALVALTAATAASAATVSPARAAHQVRAQVPSHEAGHGTAVTGVTWQKLSLVNGWQSSQSQWNSGDPAYAVKNGFVYLSGSIHQAVGSNGEFAVLPPAARPAHDLYITVYTYGGSYGYLFISQVGVVQAGSAPQSNAQAYMSLASVSYPAAATASQNLTLINGWQSSQSQWNSGNPAYAVKNGIVYLSGSMYQPSGTNQEWTVLPPAARPAASLNIIVDTYGGATGELQINPDGTVIAFSPTAPGSQQQLTSLAGISYPAAATTGAKTLTLLNGWVGNGSAPGNPSYLIKNGIVYLSGGMRQVSGNAEGFAVLPAAARPAHYLFIKMDANGAAGGLEITPGGAMSAWSTDPTRAPQYTALPGISYPVGS